VNLPATLDAARDFFGGREPTVSSAIGAAELTVAVLVVAVLAWPVGRLVGAGLGRLPRPRVRTLAGAVALAAGLLVLAAGLQHHLAASTIVLDGGSAREAGQQIAR